MAGLSRRLLLIFTVVLGVSLAIALFFRHARRQASSVEADVLVRVIHEPNDYPLDNWYEFRLMKNGSSSVRRYDRSGTPMIVVDTLLQPLNKERVIEIYEGLSSRNPPASLLLHGAPCTTIEVLGMSGSILKCAVPNFSNGLLSWDEIVPAYVDQDVGNDRERFAYLNELSKLASCYENVEGLGRNSPVKTN